jgi:protein-L-isoaspartate(D-aspartate) O-methyltransferase
VTARDPAGPGGPSPDTPDAARARLTDDLQARGRALSRPVLDAFGRVPRHLFVPEVGQSAAYRDEALVIKCGPDGIPVSSSSQPAMMAIMLEQLDLQAGHRVLEIGTGSGYNAALMSLIVGPRGTVVSVDIDCELVERARASLTAAGYPAVLLRCADGGYGDPAGAPFDRIIVTAGVWDIAPAWLDQLTGAGRLVLPLSVRGIELSVALQREAGGWQSTSSCRCGFVRMLGAFAGPQAVQRLDGPDPVYALMADGSPADAMALQSALAGPVTDVPSGLTVDDQGELGDLDLWLTVTEPGLDRLTVLSAALGAHRGEGHLLPLGGLASHATEPDRVGIAALLPGAGPGSAAVIIVRGYGPGGPALAEYLAARVESWAQLGRPGAADIRLTVVPSGVPVSQRAGQTILARPSATIAAGWPDAA